MKSNIILVLLSALFLHTTAAYAGGFIIVMPDKHANPNSIVPGQPNPALFPLESRSTQVNTNITELTATTTIKQVFFNPTHRQLEGYFLFPVPKDVIISKFTMDINGVTHEAELLDATKARKIYEEIVRRSKDPALLEYYGKGMFRVRIFPILPQKEQKIELTYTETLAPNNGTIEYSFPMNTEKYSAKPIQQVSFKININEKEKIKTIYCPTHQVEIIRKNDQNAIVGFEASNVKSDRDFKLYFNLDKKKLGLSFLNYKAPKEDGYFFINLSPGLGTKQEVVAKDIVFVMDKSGSMAGEKLEQAKKALRFCVENLNPNDRFEIIPFSTEASALFGQVENFSAENKKKAIDFIEDINPIGGTNIEEALDLALSAQQSNSKRPFFVIFMTDGKPTIGETQEDPLLKKVMAMNKENVRIFTFGIGTNLNTHLLDKITASTNAYRTYVLPDEDIEIKVSDFYTKASSPVLTDIKVEFDKNVRISDVYDKKLPDLFKGGSISLMGRYKGTGKSTITVSGNINGERKSFKYEIQLSDNHTELEFIPNLWASRAVGYLLDQIRLHGENEELVKEVTRLAKKHGIITPYTSYLILEDEAVAARRNPSIQQNNQILRPRALNAPSIAEDIDFEEEVVTISGLKGKASERKKSGSSSVRASKESQAMNKASNVADVKQGIDRMTYKDQQGTTRNLTDGIVNIQGRAMYNNNNTWLDANLSLNQDKNIKTNRIQFNSKDYYKLMENKDAIAFLALGTNVRFILNNEIYEVYE
ncbi:VIT and VWA domain-containing protein [Aureispira anguillae]|uniref:VIT and VWA domain-containing protein n=1 Tax=Aureispira anguillae TaxID=2864201 RepID=A0A915YFN5_9BACT|nr:VIT and VWA domain-containing protein [Aureispira anguillae]BDS12136.1 VIT and VWA domain-containing protein [Aureispira anguillae]